MTTEKTIGNPGRKLFFGLFVFPLLIAVGMTVLLCTVVLLTNEKETPESLIAAIKSGSPSKRWQKAFELSNELNNNPNAIRTSGIRNEVMHIFGDSAHYDEKTRGYMAMTLGRFQGPESVAALKRALKDESMDVKVYAVWSLGVLKASDAADEIAFFLSSENQELRKTAAYVLGALGSKTYKEVLLPLLEDTAADVRWNAALSLARLGSDAGQKVLIRMLDRSELAAQGLSEAEMEAVMVNAVKGLALINKEEAFQILQEASKNEKSLKVRQAALNVMQEKRAL